jgi:hypothetical protein
MCSTILEGFMWSANVRLGSKTDEIRCQRQICFPPDSDQIADITPRRIAANIAKLPELLHTSGPR